MTAYLSGVACSDNKRQPQTFGGVGPSGTFSSEGGMRWERAAKEGLNAIAALPRGRLVAVGASGAVVTADLTAPATGGR
jgi:hypothetical protein